MDFIYLIISIRSINEKIIQNPLGTAILFESVPYDFRALSEIKASGISQLLLSLESLYLHKEN